MNVNCMFIRTSTLSAFSPTAFNAAAGIDTTTQKLSGGGKFE